MTRLPSPPAFSCPGVRRHRTAPRAFSLVEVVLALGITGFTCVTLMGLLGTGLTTFSQARQATMAAQVLQDVFASTRVQNYNAQFTAKRYFNVEGTELIPSGTGTQAPGDTAYTATVQALTDPVSVQSSGAASALNKTCGCRLKVDVAAVSDPLHPNSFTIIWPEYAVPTPTPQP